MVTIEHPTISNCSETRESFGMSISSNDDIAWQTPISEPYSLDFATSLTNRLEAVLIERAKAKARRSLRRRLLRAFQAFGRTIAKCFNETFAESDERDEYRYDTDDRFILPPAYGV
jgi:hypothetical protein